MYSTEIQKYCIRKKSDEEWEIYKNNLESQNWPQDMIPTEEMYEILIQNIEKAVMESFQLKISKGKGNKIPLKAKKLMKKRSWLLKKAKHTKCHKAMVKYREMAEGIEKEISESFVKYKKKMEDKVFQK